MGLVGHWEKPVTTGHLSLLGNRIPFQYIYIEDLPGLSKPRLIRSTKENPDTC